MSRRIPRKLKKQLKTYGLFESVNRFIKCGDVIKVNSIGSLVFRFHCIFNKNMDKLNSLINESTLSDWLDTGNLIKAIANQLSDEDFK